MRRSVVWALIAMNTACLVSGLLTWSWLIVACNAGAIALNVCNLAWCPVPFQVEEGRVIRFYDGTTDNTEKVDWQKEGF